MGKNKFFSSRFDEFFLIWSGEVLGGDGAARGCDIVRKSTMLRFVLILVVCCCCLLSCLFGVGRFCMFSSVSRVFLQRSNVGKKGARRFVTGLKHEDDFPVPFHPLPSPSMYKSPRIPSQDLAPDEKLKIFFENAMKKITSYSNVCL